MLNRIMAACGILVLTALASGLRAEDYRPGPYAGLSVGYAVTPNSAGGYDLSADGFNVAGLAGWTYAYQGMVMGLEADIGLHKVDGSGAVGGAAVTFESNWYASARGRLGVPIGPALPFVTAGVAMSDQILKSGGGSVDTLRWGPIAGAGIDLQLTRTIVGRIEATRTWWTDSKFGALPTAVTSADNQVRAAIIVNLD